MNPYSCVLQAFAFAINHCSTELQERLGHDGSAIIAPELPEPFCRRGYCVDELFELLLGLGYSCTPITKYRKHCNMAMAEPIVTDTIDRVKRYLNEEKYVLYNDRHCIGVRNYVVFDPACKVYNVSDFNYSGIIIIR